VVHAGRGIHRRRPPGRGTLRALFAPAVFLLSIPVAVVAPGVAPYTWLLIFLGRPVLRRVVYR
jgi:hypothetical protein